MWKNIIWSIVLFVIIVGLLVLWNHLNSNRDVFYETTLISVIKAGGDFSFIIIFLSCFVIASGLSDIFVGTRLSKIGTPEIINSLETLINNKQYEVALTVCQSNTTPLTNILKSGLMKNSQGADEMIQAINHSVQKEMLKINHKPDKFLFIGVLVSLIGLLGSLTGMLGAFGIIKTKYSPSPSDLARGIEEALVTPIEAIFVLIACIIFYFIIQNRVNYYVQILSNLVEGFMTRIKRP